MLLNDEAVQESLANVQAAFPNFGNWEYSNEVTHDYPGFSVWGGYDVPAGEGSLWPVERSYFVTFDILKDTWKGHLSVGMPVYFWSSADLGDAILLSTKGYGTLDEAMQGLKEGLEELFKIFTAR